MALWAKQYVETAQEVYRYTPEEKQYARVPFGIYHMDIAFPSGIRPLAPQLNVIQGGGGTRKTTFFLNLLIRMCLSGTLHPDHVIAIDTLENGMTVEAYLQAMQRMMAELQLIVGHWTGYTCMLPGETPRKYLWRLLLEGLEGQDAATLVHGPKVTLNNRQVSACCFTSDFVEQYYNETMYMDERQQYAWYIAGEALKDFPVMVHGVSEHRNDEEAQRRSDITTNIEERFEAWMDLARQYYKPQIVSDYLQEYWTSESSDHYYKQKVITPWYARYVKEARATLWAISQEGIGHQKEFIKSGVVFGSSGGDVLKNASQNNWRVSYWKDTDPYHVILHAPVKSRRGNHGDLELMISPTSGLIFGKSKVVERS